MKNLNFLIVSWLLAGYLPLYGQVQPEKVELISHGSKLDATFYPGASDQAAPAVILLHGWPGNAGNPLELAPKISAAGIHVLVFNYRGTWGSEGFTSLKNSAEDVVEAVRFLKQKKTMDRWGIDTSKIIIAGYSYGGAAMLTAALHFPLTDKLISIAGADMSAFFRMLGSDPASRKGFEERLMNQGRQGGMARMEGDANSFVEEMIRETDYFDPVKNAGLLKEKKILFIVGWDDTTGKMEDNALPLYRKLKQMNPSGVSIVAFPDTHTFMKSRDDLAKTIVEWVKTK